MDNGVTQVLFIQGGGAGTHDEWDHRLVESLTQALGPGYQVRYPRMPDEDNPAFAPWKQALADELARLEDGAILVAHSVGAAVAINAVASDPPSRLLGGIVLLSAPFVGKGGWPADGFEPSEDLGRALARGMPVFLYHGTADQTVPVAHLDLYARAIPQAVVRRMEGMDHQLGDDLSAVARDIRSLA